MSDKTPARSRHNHHADETTPHGQFASPTECQWASPPWASQQWELQRVSNRHTVWLLLLLNMPLHGLCVRRSMLINCVPRASATHSLDSNQNNYINVHVWALLRQLQPGLQWFNSVAKPTLSSCCMAIFHEWVVLVDVFWAITYKYMLAWRQNAKLHLSSTVRGKETSNF